MKLFDEFGNDVTDQYMLRSEHELTLQELLARRSEGYKRTNKLREGKLPKKKEI